MNIAIVDDHPLFREALCQIASRSAPLVNVRAFVDFDALLGVMRDKHRFQIVLLDLDLPGVNGLSGIMRMQYEFPDVEIIVVSGGGEPAIQQRALLLGACQFISKSDCVRTMLSHIRDILSGSRTVAKQGERVLSCNAAAARYAGLSPTKKRIAAGAIIGLQNKVIALDLGISEGTVRNQMTAVLKDFGLRRRTELQSTFQSLLELQAVDLLNSIPDSAPGEPAEIDLLAGFALAP